MKKNRSTLKDYFKKGAIPTESNFADLIDSMLNQEEDSIAKLPNDPLKITAIGVDEALVNFYRIDNNAEKLSWQIKQKPGGLAGLNIADTAASRLFIENGTGNIGVGTTTPKAKLHVSGGAIMPDAGNTDTAGILFPLDAGGGSGDKAWMRYYSRAGEKMTLEIGTANDNDDHIALMPSGSVGIGSNAPIAKLDIQTDTRSGTHPTAVKGLYVTANTSDSSDGIEFRHTNGSQGIGFGYNTIYATGSLTDQDLGLKPRGAGKVIVKGPLQVTGGQIQVDGAQKIVFSDADTSNNLKLQLWTGYGLGINSATLFYAAGGNHSWRDTNGTNERMLLTTSADGALTVKGTGNSSFAGNLGIGTTTPGAKVEISKSAAGALGAALRISNPAGGANAQAALEFTTYDVGTSLPGFRIVVADNGNYSADVDFQTKNPGANANPLTSRLKITADGSIGIGLTTAPRTKLDAGTAVLSGAPNDYVKAQFLMSGGGTVTWGGPGGRLKWSNRFIAISMEKSISFANGHMNIYQPTTDIPAAQVYDGAARSATADGIILNAWEALYAIHTVGGNENAVNYQIVRYTSTINAPSNWLLVAVVNDDDKSVRLGTGVVITQSSSSSQSSPIPRGIITMWSGATNNIPGGWALCDGGSGTPNLKDKFIVAAGGNYAVGATGGADSVTLAVTQIPSHNHNNGDYKYLLQRDSSGRWTSDSTDTTVGEPDILHSGEIQSTGGGQAHENRPPYYALAYIMKL